MAQRITRSIKLELPGGRTNPESLARIIDTLLSKGLEPGERIDGIKAYFGAMAEVLMIDVSISIPVDLTQDYASDRQQVDDRRR